MTVPWEALGLAGVLLLWGAFGLAPWCAMLIVTRGRSALIALPFALVAGIAAGALVPALGAKGAIGFAVSLAAALAAGAVVSAAVVGRLRREEGRRLRLAG